MYTNAEIDLSDGTVFKDLFDQYYVPLCVFAEQYVPDEGFVADSVQDCFVKLWQKRDDFRYLYQVKSFLYTSVRNACLNEIAHRQVVSGYKEMTSAAKDEETFHDHVIEEEMHRIVMEAVRKLPPQSRKIIELSLENHSNAEIAETLFVSKETVHTLKKSAYRKLRKYLKGYYYFLFFF